MNCEIEFLPVGDASKAGDAIVVRYGTPSAYELMIVDGGTLDSGKLLVEHVHQQFGQDAVISHVLVTHSDADHASGIREVLEGLPVRNLWIHMPWGAAKAALPFFEDKRWTEDGLAKYLLDEYDLIADIVRLAAKKNVSIAEPFAGMQVGPFTVLSPSQRAYPFLVPQFDRTPAPDKAALENAGMWLGKAPGMLAKLAEKLVAKAQNWFTESREIERLKDGGNTGASNESSVVLYGHFGPGRGVLLTGDAGVQALSWAANNADRLGLPLQEFMFMQIPHHGSRRNVGPTILNRILGPIVPEGTPTTLSAFVSAPKDDATHPRQMVLNAFWRRGARVIATQGFNKVFWGGFPARNGYVGAETKPFVARVEDYD